MLITSVLMLIKLIKCQGISAIVTSYNFCWSAATGRFLWIPYLKRVGIRQLKLVSCGRSGSELNICLTHSGSVLKAVEVSNLNTSVLNSEIKMYKYRTISALFHVNLTNRLRNVSPPQLCKSRLRRRTRSAQLESMLVYLRRKGDPSHPEATRKPCIWS